MTDTIPGAEPSLPRAVLWDMDGTIADSAPLHWRTWHDAMAARNLRLTREQFAAAFGQKNERFLRAWLGAGPSDDEIARFGEEKEAAYRALVEAEGLEPLPGVAALATTLRAAGWRQAVASSAPRDNVAVMLRALGLLETFDTFVGAEDVTVGKPDPQVFLVAAAALHVPARRCIVIEDAVVGIEAARRAGMRSIGVSSPATLDADVAVISLADLPADTFDRLLAHTGTPWQPARRERT